MVLLRFAAVAVFSATLVACSDTPAPHATAPGTAAAPDTAAVRKAAREYRVHYNAPVSLDSTDYYYQPISVVPLEQASRSRILSSNSYGEEYDDARTGIEGTCYNVLFFHKLGRQEHALLSHGRFVVAEIDTEPKPDVRWPFLFYTLIKADTNLDGYQAGEDASALFVSDRSGRQLRQLTPDGTRLENRYILPKTSILLVEVRPDTNHDRAFTHADGTYWLRFDLQNLAAAPVRQPSGSLSNQLQTQMLERQSR